MDLIGIFQKIATTIELGRLVEFKLRFDKLGLDSDLKGLEGLSTRGALLEIQTIEPVLRRALADPGTMNISRQRTTIAVFCVLAFLLRVAVACWGPENFWSYTVYYDMATALTPQLQQHVG